MTNRGKMNRGLCRAPLSACITAVAGICLSAAALAELPVEELSVVPAITAKNRAYVSDIAINHIADGKLHVVDTDTGTYLGVIGSGFAGQYTLLPGRQRADHRHRLPVARPARRAHRHRRGLGRRHADLQVRDRDPAEARDGAQLRGPVRACRPTAAGCSCRTPRRPPPSPSWTCRRRRSPPRSRCRAAGASIRRRPAPTASPRCAETARSPPIILDGDGNAGLARHQREAVRCGQGCLVRPGRAGGRQSTTSSASSATSPRWTSAAIPPAWWTPGRWSRCAADRKKNWRPGGYQPLAVHPRHRPAVRRHASATAPKAATRTRPRRSGPST